MNPLPPEWYIDRLKDVASNNFASLPANTDPTYEFDYLEISNVNYYGVIDQNAIEHLCFEDAPSRARRCVSQNCILISSVRPNLQSVAFMGNVGSHLVCSTGFNVIRPFKGKLTPKFSYYVLVSEGARQYFEACATGVGYPAVSDKEFNSFRVPLPPLPEQERIVRFLDTGCAAIDTAVAAKRKQLETLEAARKAEITRALTRGLSVDMPLKDSGQKWLGSIPTHWSAPCLKRLLREPLTYGLNEAAELEDRNLPRYLRITDFDDAGALRDETFRSLARETAQEALLAPNDVLFARSGATVGKTFMFRDYEGEACFAGYLIRARTAPWKLRPLFLYLFTKTTAYEAWKNLIFTQATIQNISAVKYDYLAIPLPPVSEQDKICEFVEQKNAEYVALLASLERQIDALVSYRKSLIHECITGLRHISDEDLKRTKIHG